MNKLILFVNLFNNCVKNNHSIILFKNSVFIYQVVCALEQKGLIRGFFINNDHLTILLKKKYDKNVINHLKYIHDNHKYKLTLSRDINLSSITNSCFGISILNNEVKITEFFFKKKNNPFLKNCLVIVFLS